MKIARCLVVVLLAGCPSAPPPAVTAPPPASSANPGQALAWLNPCSGCSPTSYCASWVTDVDLGCDADADCIEVRIDYPEKSCSWGLWGGGGPSLVVSRAAAVAVRARMAKEDICAQAPHMGGGGPCRPPPPACLQHKCRYAEGPNQYVL
jgi:hypothetical protein